MLGVVLLVVLAGCRVDTSVTVHVDNDGSGQVVARAVLDADAVKAAELGGVKLEESVRLADLTSAGWKSSGWKRRTNGTAALTLSKAFGRPEDAGAVVAELNGPDGPLRAVKVTRATSTFSTDWSFSGVADLKDLKTGIQDDGELVARLSAERVDVAALDLRLLGQTADALRLHVNADLPHASPKVFPVRPGKTVLMNTSSSETAMGRMLMLVIGIAVLVVAVLLFIAGELRSRRRRRAARR